MSFERFTQNRIKSFIPKIVVWDKGQIAFNVAAVKQYEIDKYKYAILFYNKENNQIGIQLTNNEKEKGIIRLGKRTGGISFCGKNFLRSIGCLEKRKYNFQVDPQQENFFIIKL